jgi:SAM-dependent methyltransferase
MYRSDVNQELISLMRGFFSMPVIGTLGKLGVIDRMLKEEEFRCEDFPQVANRTVLSKSFRYLSRLGLLDVKDPEKQSFKMTGLGKEVFQRHSSFYVPHSYHEYMNSFEKLLKDGALNMSSEVDRLENVVGSGLTHQRYFLPAISFLKRRVQFDVLADVGCGNGFFLKEALKALPLKRAVGVDISLVSVRATEANLKKDALDLKNWGKRLKEIAGEQKIALTMWFLIHEISQDNPQRVIDFLTDIYRVFPKTSIVLGELVRPPAEVLSKERAVTIMPEYLFFHELSGQGILAWDEYQQILKAIPYELSSERLFDELPSGNGDYIPSAFVWCLTPRQ